MESTTIIHFVRHGHVQNKSGVYYGRLQGFPLSDEGQHQASMTREYLKDETIAAVYSSPQLRARETAQILSEPHRNVVISISQLLDEVCSPFDGFPIKKVEDRNWNVYDHGIPGYEQPEDVLARAHHFIRGVRLGHLEQQVVAVTHGDLIAFIMIWVKGIALTPDNKQSLYKESLEPGSITTLTFQTRNDDEFPRLEHLNPSMKE
jgi:broad specificity phosphatase PhoE